MLCETFALIVLCLFGLVREKNAALNYTDLCPFVRNTAAL